MLCILSYCTKTRARCLLAPSNIRALGQVAKNSAKVNRKTISGLPIPPPIKALGSEEDNAQARAWIAAFNEIRSIPRSEVEFTYSRSSGPGGQNVNKVSSKATLTFKLPSEWIPMWAETNLAQSQHYASAKNCLVISSESTRKQKRNAEYCLKKLRKTVEAASAVPNETSEETLKRVEHFEKGFKSRMKAKKMLHSAKKKSRSKKKMDFD